MQPYFFPYLGYFDLIHRTDRWIVFDTPQYIRHGWVNRNRILHPKEGWQYIRAPLQKQPRETPIKDIRVQEGAEWKALLLRQLDHYRRTAPYFEETRGFVETCLAADELSINLLNVNILSKACTTLGIAFEYDLFSSMDLALGPVEGPGDWAFRICESLGADEYLNPPGGRDIFDPGRFREAGIRLIIQEFENLDYHTAGYTFEAGLSIVDVMMWNSAEKIKEFLENLKHAEHQ